jgi:hypothetical protein
MHAKVLRSSAAKLSLLSAFAVAAVAAFAPAASPQEPIVVVTVEPRAAVNPVGTAHILQGFTKTVTGAPLPGILIRFVVLGSGSGTAACRTGGPDASCSFAYVGPDHPGADIIHVFADLNENDQEDPGEPSDDVSKAWFDPASPAPGQAHGGGQFVDAFSLTRVAFGFSARASDSVPSVHCRLVNPSNRDQVECLDATLMTIAGNQATFSGNAEVNGVPTTYTMTVRDLDPAPDQLEFTSPERTYSGVVEQGAIEVSE